MKNYALIGARLGHSLSPSIHRELFAQKKAAASYTLLEIPPERLPGLLPALGVLGFEGVNVTVPYKKALIPFVDDISPEARDIGSINTIRWQGGRTTAFNTDYFGFGRLLERASIDPLGQSALILGTGGGALAAAAYLINRGASSVSFASREGKGELLGCPVVAYSAIKACNLVVNATPLGMAPHGDATPLGKDLLPLFDIAVDLIYNPLHTRFLSEARQAGLKTAGGLDMLIGQALEAQRIWNGWSFPPALWGELRSLLEALL